MRWRILFSVLLIAGLFALISFGYFRGYVQTRTNGIILVIAPGLSPDLFRLAQLRSAKADFQWFEREGHLAMVDPVGLPDQRGDYPSLLSLLATGTAGLPGQLGLNQQGKRLDNLVYSAQRKRRSVGIVTTNRLTSPGVAAFYAHVTEAADQASIAKQLLDSTLINVAMGGGRNVFTRMSETGDRNILEEARLQNMEIVEDASALWATARWRTRPLIGIFSDDAMAGQTLRRSATDDTSPSLNGMVTAAIECLRPNFFGYFLVVENHFIADACARNRGIEAADELIALDQTMATIREYAGPKATIVLYSPFALGGLQVLRGADVSMAQREPIPLYPRLVQEGTRPTLPDAPPTPPAVSWHNGPGATQLPVVIPRPTRRSPALPPSPPPDPLQLPQEPAGFYSADGAIPSTAPGLVFISGPQVSPPQGWLSIQDLHQIIRSGF